MEAVLEMSLLEGKTVFEPAVLPPEEQLDQHVDADLFSRLVLQGVLFTAAREAMAEAIHARYLRDRAGDKEPGDDAMRPWSELAETYRKANRAQADDILRKLEQVGCGFRPSRDGKAATFRFRRDEIELLARLEHDRWMKERLDDGYTPGSVKSAEQKTHPSLVSWEQLEDGIRQYDRDTVTGIPDFLSKVGFEVYRL